MGGDGLAAPACHPKPVVLVVAGVVLGFLPFVPDASLEPHVVLLGFLPLIVFHAAFTASPREFLSHGVPIFLLGTGLVVITAAGVAVVAHFLGDLSWPMAWSSGPQSARPTPWRRPASSAGWVCRGSW